MSCVANHCMDRWDGTVAVEYALTAGLIAPSIAAALTVLGPTLNDAFFTAIAGAAL